jgi:hypothetical protein
MLKSFKQTLIMTKKEQKWYDENQPLFHKILGYRGLLYHTRVSYYYWTKEFINLICERLQDIFIGLKATFNILLNVIVFFISLFIIPFGASIRKKFHQSMWEKIKVQKNEQNSFV